MSLLNKMFNKIVEFSHKNMNNQAHLQNICGSIAMALSCAAFTGSVFFNKGIPSEQKSFLVSQELADGAINVALFLVMTDKFKKLAENKIKAGKIFPKEMKEQVKLIRAKIGENANFETMKKSFCEKDLTKIADFHTGFKNSVSLGGSLLAASIVTPIIRNIVASNFQKKHLHNETSVVKAVSPEQKPIKITKLLPVNSYSSGSQGQMKI